MKTNTIILEGGLGNRMRVAAAAYTMAQRTGIPMRVLWTSQWGMRCRFDDLFITSPAPSAAKEGGEYVLRDAQGFEKVIFARPTLKNLYLPRLLQRLCYRHIILSPQIYYLQRDGFDFETWFQQGGTLMTAYRDFCEWEDGLIPFLFRPLPAIEREVNARTTAFTPYTIGLHIRRTDNQASIDASPVELFFDVVDHELAEHDDLHVYLATDDEPTKTLFRQRYGSDRIQTAPSQATRDSVAGIREALIEMLLLARTSHVYGSAGSTFSEIAVKFSGTPLTILQR
ncbi:MAG: glycosyl transferase [Bacteroidaceae bacterium]|nr:glycosyl transferase [Bacteroidaceae bacterium]